MDDPISDEMVDDYLETILWAETDGDRPLDDTFGVDDFSDPARAFAKAELESFYLEATEALAQLERAGVEFDFPDDRWPHDFWLTRNGHGVGFWDREEVYGKEAAHLLSEVSRRFGEKDAYVGDDNRIHF